jgi:pimeloyl-ACP methyl ester carboxylesterase
MPTLNGLYYEERGSGPAILGIHGCSSSAMLWEDAAATLARYGRVITYDRRGCTRSERPDPFERIDVARHADDAAALLDALDAGPAVVIGRSYGGEVATDLTLRYPDRVRALALLEGAPTALHARAHLWTRGVAERMRAVAAERGIDAVGRALIEEVVGKGAFASMPVVVQEMFTHNGPAIVAELSGEWLLADRAVIAEIEQPVLLVSAADSRPELRQPDEVMAALLPDARTALVAGGHLIDPAAPPVLAFVEEVLAGRLAAARER